MKKSILIIAILLFLAAGAAYADDASHAFAEALTAAHNDENNFAFMQFRTFLQEYPESKYAQQAMFAIGEYYFMSANYSQAKETFYKFIEKYPDAASRIFAMAYLLNMASRLSDNKASLDIQKKIINFTRLTLLFRKSKEYKYASAFNKKLVAVYSIDSIKFYAQDKLFAEISY
ncbi:MAG: outer membrane protein assembly factor BamD [Candidatus Omnitrophota bacterium]